METLLKVLPRFDKNDPDFVNRTRYMIVGGGLGDIFNHFHMTPCYADLETLKDGERVFVFLASHNSCAVELFKWHRNASRITMVDTGILNVLYSQNENDKRVREEMGIRTECEHRWENWPRPVVYYPSPADVEILERTKAMGKYVVFALTASNVSRSIDKGSGENAARICQKLGYKVVLTGRNYQFNDHGRREQKRDEIRLENPDVIDLIDRLTVPGTAKLVEGASAVFTCHSALCMLAWHLQKPTFVLYDDFAKRTYFTHKFEGYSFGAGFPKNDHARLDQYSDERFTKFIEGVGA